VLCSLTPASTGRVENNSFFPPYNNVFGFCAGTCRSFLFTAVWRLADCCGPVTAAAVVYLRGVLDCCQEERPDTYLPRDCPRTDTPGPSVGLRCGARYWSRLFFTFPGCSPVFYLHDIAESTGGSAGGPCFLQIRKVVFLVLHCLVAAFRLIYGGVKFKNWAVSL